MVSPAPSLPSGRVTFVFTDVVGSTRTFVEHGDVYVEALERLHATIADHAARRGGVVVETEGDGALVAFPDAVSAVEALIGLQAQLEAASGPGLLLRIRAGAHSGDAVPLGGHYLALPVYVAARVSATANAGQLLVTEALVDELHRLGWSDIAAATEVGSYSLKDIPEPVAIWRLAGDEAPPRATPARRTNVQQSRTSFVGRERETNELRALVSSPGLVTVLGPGGVGKTRLVSEFALNEAETFPGGAWLVELAALEASDPVVAATGAALGLTTTSTEDVLTELKHRARSLLVLDNCEQLIDSVVDLVQPLLEGCPELTVLCTSREPLALPAEHSWAVPPLAPGEESVRLFLDRAPTAVRPALDLDLVQELCAALDGLPLAIELAASQSGTAPLRELLDIVRSGQDPLSRRGGHERQLSLDATLQWSLDRLPAGVRDALLVLSVFPGRFSPQMAQDVLAAVPRCDESATRTLARGSLVDLDGDDYRLLTTIRDSARRLLAQDPELNRQALDALTEWTRSYGVAHWEAVSSDFDLPPDTMLALEAGLWHALEAGIAGLGKTWDLVNQTETRVAGASRSLVALAEAALDLPVSDADAVLLLASAAGISRYNGGSRHLSTSQASDMVEVARASGDPRVLERALHSEATLAHVNGDWDAAMAHRLEIVDLVSSGRWQEGKLLVALINLGNTHDWSGDHAAAVRYNQLAADASSDPALWYSKSLAHLNLGELAQRDGDPVAARDHLLTAFRAAPVGWNIRSSGLARLAIALASLGDQASAVAAAREALPDLRKKAQSDMESAVELGDLLEGILGLFE